MSGGFTRYPGGNFEGGGAGGAGSALQTLTDAELAGLNGQDVSTPNSILDTYNSEIAALGANSEITKSLARLVAGQNDNGTVEHELNLSVDMTKVDGGIVASLHAAAVQSVTGNDMVVKGDATSLFPDASRVLIMTKIEQLGRTTHTGLSDNDNNIARLIVTSTSFDGTDTTITLTNLTPVLDLSMGVAALDMPDQLRLAPFDWDLEASATGTGAYEALDLTDLHGVDDVRLEGTNFYKLIEALTGTIDKLDGVMSQNGQYGFVRILENTAGNDTFHWYGSSDRGNSWFKLVGTKDSGQAAIADEFSNNFHFIHRTQLDVANNGKFICSFPVLGGTGLDVHAVYGNVSEVTPAINDTPDVGLGVGIINASAVDHSSSVAIDRIDGSYFSVAWSNSSNNGALRAFTNNPTPIQDFVTGIVASWDFTTPYRILISGTGVAHKTQLIQRQAGAGDLRVSYYDEGNSAFNNYSSEFGSNMTIIDAMLNDTYLFVLFRDVGGPV